MGKNRIFDKGTTKIETLGEDGVFSAYKPFKFSIWPPLTISMIQGRNRVFTFIVSLESRVKPKMFANLTITPTNMTSKELLRTINVYGGSLAEHLVEKYGDTYDPSDVAKEAQKTFEAMMLEYSRSTGN